MAFPYPHHMHQQLINLTRSLQQAAQASFQRRLLVISGRPEWCRDQAAILLKTLDLHRAFWIGSSAPDGINSLRNPDAPTYLGSETETLIYDCFSGLDPDALGALCGTLQGGGLLIMLTPILNRWSDYADPEHERITVAGIPVAEVSGRFLGRVARLTREDPRATLVQEGGEIPSPQLDTSITLPTEPVDSDCRTSDQLQAVESVMHVVTGHRRRPVVLLSDRGRGKSSALGIAAARLVQQREMSILVTAPRRSAVEPLFQHAGKILDGAQSSKSSIRFDQSQITFSAPDDLLLHPQSADLLLVDEAAAIPTPILEGLLSHYPRIAFATTVHGYEGTGRGFAVRFRQVLDSQFPQWRELHMQMPIRWAADDPVEPWLFKVLALDATPVQQTLVADATTESCQFEILDRDALAADERDLTALFGLLVLAHYRTTPLDLRHLLDGPNLSVAVLRHQGHVVATALVAREGGFAQATAHAIWCGYRRPRGHLLAQSLAAHVGLESAACLQGARIMRIAVHPALQQRGLGSRLVGAIQQHSAVAGLDYLGASFGATPALIQFWFKNRFHPVRIGLRRGASSGTESVIMLQPLNESGESMMQSARAQFSRQFPRLLADPLRAMDRELACSLMQSTLMPQAVTLTQQQWLDLLGFGFARRGYETTLPAIETITTHALRDPGFESSHSQLLLMRIMQKADWPDCARAFHLAGRGDVEKVLRRAVADMILHYADAGIRKQALRLQSSSAG